MQKLGQHFLNDTATRKKIASVLFRMHAPVIIEIGPGHGELTNELIKLFPDSRIIVIERDAELAQKLRLSHPRLEIQEGDAREILPALPKILGLKNGEYIITGNIPYYITGNLFRILGELKPRPLGVTFMIQKEVGERVSAEAPNMNLLAACVQAYADVSYEFTVPKKVFCPPPKVDSAVVSILFHEKKLPTHYFDVVHGAFKQPRKTILNNIHELMPVYSKEELEIILRDSGIREQDRPQSLSVLQIISLAERFEKELTSLSTQTNAKSGV